MSMKEEINNLNIPVYVVMCGEGVEAPAFLDYELEQIIGRPVKVEWRQVKQPKSVSASSRGDE